MIINLQLILHIYSIYLIFLIYLLDITYITLRALLVVLVIVEMYLQSAGQNSASCFCLCIFLGVCCVLAKKTWMNSFSIHTCLTLFIIGHNTTSLVAEEFRNSAAASCRAETQWIHRLGLKNQDECIFACNL